MADKLAKKFGYKGFTATSTGSRVKIEIDISNLVCAFEGCPDNSDEYGEPFTIKRGKKRAFANWVAEHVMDEADQHEGNTYVGQMLDSVFNLLFEGYELGDEFLVYPKELKY
jgi:hypothetical protein